MGELARKGAMTRPGSVLILVLVSIAALNALCFRQWFATTHILDAVLQKERYEQRFWIAQGLLDCSIAFCSHQWPRLHEYMYQEGIKKMTLAVHHGLDDFNAELYLYNQSPEKMHLELRLIQKEMCVASHQCTLTCTSEQAYRVTEWQST